MPKVSVITCTYNRAHLIGETMRSVLNQSFQDFEYIIVDDGSTDDTEKIVNSFSDARIKYFYHHHTHGHLSVLRNFAHAQSKGELIAYVDSDDIWVKDKLEIQVNAFNSDAEIGFSFTDIEIFRANSILRQNIYGKSGEFIGSVFPEMLNNTLIICHTTLMVRKSSLQAVGNMDVSFHSGDHNLVFFLSRLFKAHVAYSPLVRVRKHDQNSTNNHQLTLKLLAEHHLTLSLLHEKGLIDKNSLKQALAKTSYEFATQLNSSRDFLSIKKYLFKSIANQPFQFKSYIYLAKTLAKEILGR